MISGRALVAVRADEILVACRPEAPRAAGHDRVGPDGARDHRGRSKQLTPFAVPYLVVPERRTHSTMGWEAVPARRRNGHRPPIPRSRRPFLRCSSTISSPNNRLYSVAASTGLSRAGDTSVVYLGELIGIALMFCGFTLAAPAPRRAREPEAAPRPAVAAH